MASIGLLLIDMNDAAALSESQEIFSSTFSVKDWNVSQDQRRQGICVPSLMLQIDSLAHDNL